MSVLTEQPAPPSRATSAGPTPGPSIGRLIRGELLKVRTTNLWWILGICAFAAVGLALLVNITVAHFEIHDALNPPNFSAQYPPDQQPTPAQLAELEAQWRAEHVLSTILIRNAANIYTSGQFFGLLIVMLFGAILVTGEFYNQTATTTFLISPRRSNVIGAKVVAAIVIGAIAWLVTTVLDLGAGAVFFSTGDYPSQLDAWDVQRSILMNLPAYALWALLGMGLGALIRNQIAATLVGAGLYLIGGQVAQLVFVLIHQFVIKQAWVLQAMVSLPAVASSVMITPQRVQVGSGADGGAVFLPQWWVGALVLIGYGVVATLLGTLILRRRDIS